ncbi:iron ABC transporter permease, partial [Candidatus Nomurabacteria bacterium]|nr:iron ABC transporter permease [Candidatus Nomurabacteria bacterium]
MKRPSINRKRKEIPLVLFMSVGIPILFIAVIISVAFGAVRYDPIDILRLFALKTGLINSAELPGGMEMAVLMIRMPRVISAVVAGAGLAISGAVMQGVFRNPLAEPGLLGVSSGSGLGTLIAMSTGIASFYILP